MDIGNSNYVQMGSSRAFMRSYLFQWGLGGVGGMGQWNYGWPALRSLEA